MNQIKIFLFVTLLFSNFFGLFANTIESINHIKNCDLAEKATSLEKDSEALDFYYELDSYISDCSSFNLAQMGLSYLNSNVYNEKVISNIEKSAENFSDFEHSDLLCFHIEKVSFDVQEKEQNSKASANQASENTSANKGTDSYAAAFTIEIKFGFDTAELSQACLKDIEVLYSTFKQHKEAYIEIAGHTDSKGSDSHNKALSQARADAVKKYLVNKGIPKDRIMTKAIGSKQPISPNINPDGSDNPEGRANNRRTDIKIVNY